ncbi:unnamed protein product [Boreogadus saida]
MAAAVPGMGRSSDLTPQRYFKVRRKMSKEEAKREKASQAESRALHLAEPKDVSEEHVHPQKVLKIFSINIITQGLPFCRRRTHAGFGSLDMDVHIRSVMIDRCLSLVFS